MGLSLMGLAQYDFQSLIAYGGTHDTSCQGGSTWLELFFCQINLEFSGQNIAQSGSDLHTLISSVVDIPLKMIKL